MDKKHIGYEVHTLDNMIGRLISFYRSKLDEEVGLTAMQSWIIGYLYRHPNVAVFQKDLEAEFHIARSTATGILQVMEKKGFIVREAYPGDARLKRLVLTEKGISLQIEIFETFDNVNKLLAGNISSEDLDIFYNVIAQIRQNIENAPVPPGTLKDTHVKPPPCKQTNL